MIYIFITKLLETSSKNLQDLFPICHLNNIFKKVSQTIVELYYNKE